MKRISINIKNKIARIVSLAVLLLTMSLNSFAEGEGNEYNIKAMFILNFMKYVEWPASDKGEFVIGIAGDSQIYDALITMIASRKEDKKIIIERVSHDDIKTCQILVISKNENKHSEEWSKKYQGKGVLIITEESKRSNTAAINLVNVNNKIRFEINNTQARLGGIKISSRLSDLAVSVQP